MTMCAHGAPFEEVAIHFDATDFFEDPVRRKVRLCYSE